MTDWRYFLDHLDWQGLLGLLLTAAVSLFCITAHELSHGYAAYRLGDPTAKNAGRLTFNPIKHIDPFGLVMMLVARVGWAKPVPVDMRYFKDHKKGMALTALAGPAANFVLALLSMALLSLLYHAALAGERIGQVLLVILLILTKLVVLNVGLGLFNLIPIPPLDGSKVLFSFLPESTYRTILRYERYIMLLVVVLTASGALSRPLSWLIGLVLRGLCLLTGCPEWFLYTLMSI